MPKHIWPVLVALSIVMYLASFISWNAPFWAAAGFAALMIAMPEWLER